MSQENVEAVREWIATVNRGDLEAALELAAPDIEYMSYLATVSGGGGAYRGHDGLRHYFRDLAEAWASFRIDPDEIRDLGHRVLMVARLRATGRSSGLEVEKQAAWLHSFHPGSGPGRHARVDFFETVAEALEANSDATSAEDNIEAARRLLGAVGQRDLEQLRELTAPEVEWRSFFAAVAGKGEYHGHEDLAEYLGDVTGAWETLTPEPDDLLAVGDLVLAVGRIHFRGKQSEIEAETPTGWLIRFREGKVVRFVAFKDPEQALDALGRE